ncbi:unnamed protein product [Darwinula stevensoni]|uniref:Uncharacterized protein n=1 Tax=Darwinula stevensoni TaxID=69355 RepID=A0A7R8X989_9CRUS|nr:unnamed protein product [Darwinula stevensoni]CAG0890423.1 unnamed protein product [Darwinula stevensoni]
MAVESNLEWSTQCTGAFAAFNQFLNQETLVDITLSCDGQVFRAHKLVLCARSGFFKRTLQHDANANPIMYFFGVPIHLMKLLVHFLYTGEANVNQKDLDKFLELAKALEVNGLQKTNFQSGPSSRNIIPVSDIHEALAHKRKSFNQSDVFHHEVLYAKKTKVQGIISKSPSTKSLKKKVSFMESNRREGASYDLAKKEMGNSLDGLKGFVDPGHLVQEEKIHGISIQDTNSQGSGLVMSYLLDFSAKDEERDFMVLQNLDMCLQPGTNQQEEVGSQSVENLTSIPENIPPDVDPVTVTSFVKYIWSGRTLTEGRNKVYFCQLCPYKSPTSSHAKTHVVVHTRERSHVCNECGKAYLQSAHLIRHLRHHEKKGSEE